MSDTGIRTTDIRTTVHRMFEDVISHGKVDLVDDLFDPDFQSVTPQGVLHRERFKDYVRGWLTGFPDAHCEVYDLVTEGDIAAWGVRARGTHTGEFMGIPATGNSIDFLSLNLAHFRGGRGHRHHVMMDVQTLLSQLGVNPG